MSSITINNDGSTFDEADRKKPKKSFLANWSYKAKILLGVVIILVAFLALNYSPAVVDQNIEGAAFVATIGSELPTLIAGYKVELYANGDNNAYFPDRTVIMFPYSVLLHVNDTSCETIFGEVTEITSVFEQSTLTTDEWASWIPGRLFNSLTEITPYEKYYISASADCTLDLSAWATSEWLG